jgi:hypothetical protein
MGTRWESFSSAGIEPVEFTGEGTKIPEITASQSFSMGAGAAGTTVVHKPQP